MIKVVYIFLLIFISIFIQVLVGSAGLILPITALSIFYLTIITDWQTGILTAAITGSIVDIIYGRTIFLSPALLVIVALLAILWLYKGELKYLPLQTIPAGFISFIYICPGLFVTYHLYEQGVYLFLEKLLIVLLSLILSSLIFPPFIVLMDKINTPLKLNLYIKSKERISRE
jgi:hypothetical protein